MSDRSLQPFADALRDQVAASIDDAQARQRAGSFRHPIALRCHRVRQDAREHGTDRTA